ncbi:LysE family translocator [Thalassotalea aquiviva]|uniref:LysE family translocator n=1 Tax=Thalassotalea aquiviva TaxID=3242415 RepID=UPI00352A84AC
MAVELWLSLVLICILGALSPGPSLALVIRYTICAGSNIGFYSAISHGVAITLYAAIAVTGIGLVIVQSPLIFKWVQYSGAAFLVYLAFKALTSKASTLTIATTIKEHNINAVTAIRDGFLIAFLNPKIAIFFLALFSQFVDIDAHLSQKILLVLTVGCIDTLWYVLVAYGLSRGPVLERLKSQSYIIDRITAVVLIFLAFRVVLS